MELTYNKKCIFNIQFNEFLTNDHDFKQDVEYFQPPTKFSHVLSQIRSPQRQLLIDQTERPRRDMVAFMEPQGQRSRKCGAPGEDQASLKVGGSVQADKTTGAHH